MFSKVKKKSGNQPWGGVSKTFVRMFTGYQNLENST
jgi:hypothetical protein